MLRGVSGGERKRVTVGEMLVGGQSIFLCDEISTGLDSAATYDIVNALKTWTKSLGGSCIVALLQPPPEVVELFDDILMLSDGHLVRSIYYSPNQDTRYHLASTSDDAKHLMTTCGRCTTVRGRRHCRTFSHSGLCARRAPIRQSSCSKSLQAVASSTSTLVSRDRSTNDGYERHRVEHPTPAPATSDAFGEAFAASPMHAAVRMWLKNSNLQYDVTSVKRLAFLARRTTRFSLAFWDSTKLLMARQVVFWIRDKELLYGKFIESCVEGLLLGIIYLNCDASLYLRMLFFTIAIFLVFCIFFLPSVLIWGTLS